MNQSSGSDGSANCGCDEHCEDSTIEAVKISDKVIRKYAGKTIEWDIGVPTHDVTLITLNGVEFIPKQRVKEFLFAYRMLFNYKQTSKQDLFREIQNVEKELGL